MFHNKLQKSYLILLDKLLNNYENLTNDNIRQVLKQQKNIMDFNYIKLLNYYKELFIFLKNNKENSKYYIDKIPNNIVSLQYKNFDFSNIELKEYKFENLQYKNLQLKDYKLFIELKDFIKEGYKELTGNYLKEIILADKKNLEIYVKNKLSSNNKDIITKINNNISEKEKTKLLNKLIFNLEINKNENISYLKEDIQDLLLEIKNNYHYIDIDNLDKKTIFNNIFFFFNTLLKNYSKLEENFINLITNIVNIKPFIDDYYNILSLIYLKIIELDNVNDITYNQILFQLRKHKSL